MSVKAVLGFLLSQSRRSFSVGGCFLFSAFYCHSQTFLNVTNFGAVDDVEALTVSCVSNSSEFSVVSTNWAGTNYAPQIGDVIEVFGAGPQLQFSNDPPYVTTPFYGQNPGNPVIVTNQDIICLITNITDGTNLWCPIPAGWTMNAYCVVGTNNAAAFQAAIDEGSNIVATSEYTNATINIPAGTYLIVSSSVLNPNYVMSSMFNTHPALTVSSGGITFEGLGNSATDTVLMGCGAGMDHILNNGSPYGLGFFNVMRDTLVECLGPVQNGQDPLSFENLTFDGGVQNGMQGYRYWTLNEANGAGWDTTHHAVADGSSVATATVQGQMMNQLKVFTNCVFQHWRGEMCICWTGDVTNGFNDWENCQFLDGNATADNMYYGQHVHGCVFDNVAQLAEFYQANSSLPTVWENNYATNAGAIVINGAMTNPVPPSFLICSNQFTYGGGVLCTPAENLTISNNYFGALTIGINLTAAGLQGNSPIRNLVIEDNVFSTNVFQPIVDAGYATMDVLVSNNIWGGNYGNHYFAQVYGGFQSNWVFADNYAPASLIDSTAVGGGSYFLDETNNTFGTHVEDIDGLPTTNIISYGNGINHQLFGSGGAMYYLDDTHPNLIPAGAQLEVWANTYPAGNVTNFYTSLESPVPPMTITNGAPPITFYWTGSSWATGFPVAYTASSTNGVAALAVRFSCPASDSGGNTITSWRWSFGDGATTTVQNPSHTYTNPGSFYPTLTVVDTAGISSGSYGPAITVTNPVVSFTAGPAVAVAGTSVQFNSPGADSGGNSITSWNWNFGDGNMGTGENPVHAYTSVGTFYPVLTATNVYGVSSMGFGAVITITNPVVRFTASPTNACPNFPIQLTSPSVDSGGNQITSWQWNFGDGASSTVQNPTHTYAAAGTYQPMLAVRNAYGLAIAGAGPCVTVVNPTVSSSASPTNGVSRLTAQFTSPTVDSLGVAIKGWQWNFGDGSTGAGENPVHIYTNNGTFYPVLIVTNSVGALATNDGAGITVTNPVIQFTASRTNVCPNLAIQFSAPTIDSGGNAITSWQWSFGDGTSSSLQNPTHSYVTNGTFHPLLSVRNAYGLAPTSSGPAVNVSNPSVTFSATPTNGVSRLTVQFQSPTADSLGVAISGWQWNFGDGFTGAGENPTHIYTNIGTFYPVLTVTNSVGALATNNGLAITVTNPIIIFNVTPASGNAPLTVQFQSQNTDSAGNQIASWQWNFGDGTTGTGENPTHVYTNAGVFYPVLMATNVYGVSPICSGSAVTATASAKSNVSGNSSAATVASPPPPPLILTMSGGNAILSWAATSDNCTLQCATNIFPVPVWTDMTCVPVIINGQYVVTNCNSGTCAYYRLKQTTSAADTNTNTDTNPGNGSQLTILDFFEWLLQLLFPNS